MSDKSTWVEVAKEAVKAQRWTGNLSFTLLMPSIPDHFSADAFYAHCCVF